jgi:hypothetical protein
MKKTNLLFFCLSLALSAYSQSNPIDCKKIHNNPMACQWTYFETKDTLHATVIRYDPPMGACAWGIHAGVGIVRLGTDTVRVLFPCIDVRYIINPGSTITLLPSHSSFRYISLPSHIKYLDDAKKKTLWYTNEYDSKVKRTTWAYLSDTLNRKIHFYSEDNGILIATNSFSFHWKIIADSGTTSGTIIKFNPAHGRCGIEKVSAVAILKRENDTIRVILPCCRHTLKPGDQVAIKIFANPKSSLLIPQDVEYTINEKKKGFELFRVNEYDETILSTVFGTIKKIN